MNAKPSAPIEQYLPHRRPMLMVEQIRSVEEFSIETSSVVRDTWPTASAGSAATFVLTELIAQSAAVLQGWRDKSEGKPAVGGLLVGVPRAKLHRARIAVGTTVRCVVRISHGVQGYLAFEGEAYDESGVKWIEASIQAVRPELAAGVGNG